MSFDVFIIFLGIRIFSVFVVQTFFVPDEYWQSLEVSHKMVFGYGYLTWEWDKGIRSYIPCLIFSVFYKILQIIGMDTATNLIYGPRILQAILSAYSDLCFYKWSGTKKWAAFCITTSWFWFYTGSRTMINTLECALTSVALYKFPWPGKRKDDSSSTFLWIVSFLFVIRPTCVTLWIPLCFYHAMFSKKIGFSLLLRQYIQIGLTVLCLSILVDSIAHGSFIITSYEFLKFNVLQDIASFYGVQPWHWYLSTGFPAILGIYIVPFAMATLVILKHRKLHPNELIILGTIVFNITLYSFLEHKEFRFLLPLLPLVLYISSRFLSAWSRKTTNFYVWIVTAIIFVGNAVPSWYLGMVHQRGTLDVMKPLRELSEKNATGTNLLFLMPCHSTPMYSHLHVNVTTRFLTCLPNFNKLEEYMDEADTFYNNPNAWIRQNYSPNGTLPSHIICFDKLVRYISDILSRYKETHRIYHTNLPTSARVGKYVMIFENLNL